MTAAGQAQVDPRVVVHHLEQMVARMAHDYAVMAAHLDYLTEQLAQRDEERAARVASSLDTGAPSGE